MIPTISLSNSTQEDIADALCDVCSEVGFFYLADHSIPQSLIDCAFESSKKLFALPIHQKEILTDPILNRGYTKYEEETLDPKNQPNRGDTKEGYYIGDEIEIINADKLDGPNVWPSAKDTQFTQDECKEFRNVMEQYRTEAIRVCMKLLKCFALAVGSKDIHLFDEYFTQPPKQSI